MKRQVKGAFLLSPLAMLFGAVAVLRGKLFDWGVLREQRFPIPLIGVGNLAVGGTGKTPHVEYILRLLHEQGWQVAMLSRGYGRHTRGFVMASDVTTASDIGDEPFQVKQNCPFAVVAVCEKRVEGVQRLLESGVHLDAIVLDDAYQHRYVKPGLSILLTECNRLYTHDHFLPWGRLREPASAARRADVVVVTKCGADRRPQLPVADHQTLFYSQIVYASPTPWGSRAAQWPAKENGQPFAGKRVLLIAAIAHPEPLAAHLRKCGAEVTLAEFRDHHDFKSRDAARLAALWKEIRGDWAVTTQKDVERLRQIAPQLPTSLVERLWVQPIGVSLQPASNQTRSFNQIIIDYVRANQRNGRVD